MARIIDLNFGSSGTINTALNTINVLGASSGIVITGRTGSITSVTGGVFDLDLIQGDQVTWDDNGVGQDGLILAPSVPYYGVTGTFTPVFANTAALQRVTSVVKGLAIDFAQFGAAISGFVNCQMVMDFQLLNVEAFSVHLGTRMIRNSFAAGTDQNMAGAFILRSSTAGGGGMTYGIGRNFSNGTAVPFTNTISTPFVTGSVYRFTLKTTQVSGNAAGPIRNEATLQNITSGTTIFNDTVTTSTANATGYNNVSSGTSTAAGYFSFGFGGYNGTEITSGRIISLTVDSLEDPVITPAFSSVYLRPGFQQRNLTYKVPLTFTWGTNVGDYGLELVGTAPSGVTLAFDSALYNPTGTANGFLLITCTSGCASAGSGTIQVGVSGFTGSRQTLTFVFRPNVRTANSMLVNSIGSSTVDLSDEYFDAQFGSYFGGSPGYTINTTKSAYSASSTETWSSLNYIWTVLNEAVNQRNFDLVGQIPYSNDSQTWAEGVSGRTRTMIQTFIEGGCDVHLTEFQYRDTETANGVVQAGSTSAIVTLAGGTFVPATNYAGSYLACKLNATDWSKALIVSNTSGTFTVSGPTLDGTPVSGVTAYILSGAGRANFDTCASGIAAFSSGGASDLSTSVAKVIYHPGWNAIAEPYFSRGNGGNNDWIHLTDAGSVVLANFLAQNVARSYLSRAATVLLPDISVNTSAQASISGSVSGFATFNHTFWPPRLASGTYTLVAGEGSINGNTYTAPATEGSATGRFTLTNYSSLFDDNLITINAVIPPESVRPVLNTAIVSSTGTTIVLSLTEVDSVPLLPASSILGFSITVNGGVSQTLTGTRTGSTQVTLSPSAVLYNDDIVLLSYSPAAGNLTDSATNELDTITDFTVDMSLAPTAPPAPEIHYSDAYIDTTGTYLIVQLGGDHAPFTPLSGVSGFTILYHLVSGGASISDNEFQFHIRPKAYTGEHIYLSYSGNTLQDDDGNLLSAFSSRSITNNTTVQETETPITTLVDQAEYDTLRTSFKRLVNKFLRHIIPDLPLRDEDDTVILDSEEAAYIPRPGLRRFLLKILNKRSINR